MKWGSYSDAGTCICVKSSGNKGMLTKGLENGQICNSLMVQRVCEKTRVIQIH
ncbi:hypothetical protein PM082_004478 [Marasmius tenuissimus]|nr:hypothetical protein PM082_004478 [Marasmius tenuissimus]